jgi:hypothetical protein
MFYNNGGRINNVSSNTSTSSNTSIPSEKQEGISTRQIYYDKTHVGKARRERDRRARRKAEVDAMAEELAQLKLEAKLRSPTKFVRTDEIQSRRTNEIQTLRRMVKFCSMLLAAGAVEPLSQDEYNRMKTIADPVKWLEEWCNIYGVSL